MKIIKLTVFIFITSVKHRSEFSNSIRKILSSCFNARPAVPGADEIQRCINWAISRMRFDIAQAENKEDCPLPRLDGASTLSGRGQEKGVDGYRGSQSGQAVAGRCLKLQAPDNLFRRAVQRPGA